MSKDKFNKPEDTEKVDDFETANGNNEATADDVQTLENEEKPVTDESALSDEETQSDEITRLKEELEKQKKEYLFLMADFDNFRKRTLKEKSEIIKNAGEQVLKGMLPIVDDFERGISASEKTDNAESALEGMRLIYNKLVKYLQQNGVKAFESTGEDFDDSRMEALSVVPATDDDQKNKVIDTIEKGYTINDKVLRHAKVVVAQ